ncbi:MAG: hypothetical protein EOO41_03800 [Methanobacteriota archaeon]|nr:MAG: hypothetical protein EOO41_03800 [Euryarchaeota archaeon]
MWRELEERMGGLIALPAKHARLELALSAAVAESHDLHVRYAAACAALASVSVEAVTVKTRVMQLAEQTTSFKVGIAAAEQARTQLALASVMRATETTAAELVQAQAALQAAIHERDAVVQNTADARTQLSTLEDVLRAARHDIAEAQQLRDATMSDVLKAREVLADVSAQREAAHAAAGEAKAAAATATAELTRVQADLAAERRALSDAQTQVTAARALLAELEKTASAASAAAAEAEVARAAAAAACDEAAASVAAMHTDMAQSQADMTHAQSQADAVVAEHRRLMAACIAVERLRDEAEARRMDAITQLQDAEEGVKLLESQFRAHAEHMRYTCDDAGIENALNTLNERDEAVVEEDDIADQVRRVAQKYHALTAAVLSTNARLAQQVQAAQAVAPEHTDVLRMDRNSLGMLSTPSARQSRASTPDAGLRRMSTRASSPSALLQSLQRAGAARTC